VREIEDKLPLAEIHGEGQFGLCYSPD